MSGEHIVTTRADLNSVLAGISFEPSAVTPRAPRFQIEDLSDGRGWLVRLVCRRPDTLTGEMGEGHGRWELIEQGTTESGAVKTCWLLYELYIRHEAMESFTFRGKRIFDPHRSVHDLADGAREVGT